MQYLLYPLSLIYGLVMLVRNFLFDRRILHSKSYAISLISVGNLSMGGTGKTPHIEYIIRLLKEKHLIATLSRGYGRNSSGFILGSKRSNVKYIGDEPMQFIKKFANIKVAVDEKRTRGIELLLEKNPALEIILLDDAFQHRWVKPGFSILLSDYHHLYIQDHLIPAGRLRESATGAKRADCIIVTKTPKVFSPITRRRIIADLNPRPHQKVFFSYIKYGALIPLHDHLPSDYQQKYSFILLFTGIANNDLLKEQLRRMCNDLTTIEFRDHHQYNEQDLKKIMNKYDNLPSQKKILITTEKDIMRLRTPELISFLKTMPIYYIPIEIDFHGDDKQSFDKSVIDYVEENKRNRRVSRDKNPE
jgi:tetraacyldisaccharide 4'-kinase